MSPHEKSIFEETTTLLKSDISPISKPTPGSWTIDVRAGNGCCVTGVSAFVADCSPRAGGPMVISECQANARLVAAAPELLEALKQAIQLNRLQCKNPDCTCVQCRIVSQMKNVIAKAEGRD